MAGLSGSSCVPLSSSFVMDGESGDITVATAEWVPISVTSYEKANFKVSILATFSRELRNDNFSFAVYVDGQTCDTCSQNITLSSQNSTQFKVNYIIIMEPIGEITENAEETL